MITIGTRFFLTLSVLAAFFVPLMIVVALETSKQENKLILEQAAAASAKKDAQEARYRYYLGVAQQRAALNKSMADAKDQYEKLLKDQPQMVKDNQKTVTQTTVEPVTVQKVVTSPVSTKPKSSSKTKTS
ncbi:MAG: hypothetical protein PHT88_01200 [Candidatus Moranbacteria bacterium]|nr:hypothetical protein [Candidatus Moranbacteria bacterium]